MTILFLFFLLFLLMFIGVPIAASLGLAGSVTIMLFSARWRSSCLKPPSTTPCWRFRSSCCPVRL